jgi:hypothetical protein
MELAEIRAGFVATGVPAALVSALLAEYEEAKRRFYLDDHMPTAVEGGRFAEAALRVLEHSLLGSATPLGQSLPPFTVQRLAQFEGATSVHESLRIHVPRALFSILAVRNKRDAAHLNDGISANLQDATYVVGVLDWVLAEFVRVFHDVPPGRAQAAIEDLVKRQVPVIEVIDGQPVCSKVLGVSDKALLFLNRAGRDDGLPIAELQRQMMYSDRGNLTRALKTMAGRRLVLLHPGTGKAHITSEGMRNVEARRVLHPAAD